MEVALASAVLVGIGLVLNKFQGQTVSEDVTSTNIRREPGASNERNEYHTAANISQSITAAPVGNMSGRRDNSISIGSSSPYETQMSRVYKPPDGTKREVEHTVNPLSKQDNVFVRSQSSYQQKFFDELQKPVRMHNVNPIATTTGTASQLVGPGIGAGQNETGNDGFHYGMVRMKPNITRPTYREHKGSIIPGKNPIDKRTNEVHLMRHAASGFSISPEGFARNEETNPEPLKFHAISEEYMTSAPGRSIVTGNTGAGGKRLEPNKDNTNRGAETPHWGGGALVGMEAPDSRRGYTPLPASNRGKPNDFLGITTGASKGGYKGVIDNFTIPAESRNATEPNKHVLNISNPGQSVGMLHNGQEMQKTQRQTMCALDVINLKPQVPEGLMGNGDPTRTTARVTNTYRPGGASLASVPELGGQQNLLHSYSTGELNNKTQRESIENNEFEAPLKAVGVNAPMSYADILKSEGYSNRDLPQLGFVAPAAPTGGGNNFQTTGMGAFDARPDEPNTTRLGGGGVGNQQLANFHIVNHTMDHNPNKIERMSKRLDPQILSALSQNELLFNKNT